MKASMLFRATLLAMAVVLVLLPGSSHAQRQDGLETAFTYQGRLLQAGNPVTDACDFRFTLMDGVDGHVIGSPLALASVAVNDGLFTVELDFGADAFDARGRLLAIEVRCPAGSGAYTTLSPRQKLTAAPYALYAREAPWSGLSDVPPGLDDGDDNTTYTAGPGLMLADSEFSLNPAYGLPQTCGIGEVVKWNGDIWDCSPDSGGDITAVNAGSGLTGGGAGGAVTLAVDFAGSGSADAVARADHNHLGQTWTGSDNPLTIAGSFSDAPLVLSNNGGRGLHIESTDNEGVYVHTAGSPSNWAFSAGNGGFEVAGAEGDGVWVGYADWKGVEVGVAGQEGVYVHDAGNSGVRIDRAGQAGVNVNVAGSPSEAKPSGGKHGFAVAGAEGSGLYVGRADTDGVYLNSVGRNGVTLGYADFDGVNVYSAGRDGVFVQTAGSPSTVSQSTGDNGFEVAGAAGDGLYVGRADWNGVEVNSAELDGVHVKQVGVHGLSVGSTGWSGVYVNSAQKDGVQVNTVGEFGVAVGHAGDDGVHIGDVGNASTVNPSPDHNGFEVEGAQGHGLYVGQADLHGIEINAAEYAGVHVKSARDGLDVSAADADGVYIGLTNDDGVDVYWANDDGVHVEMTGLPSSSYDSDLHNGFEVAGAQGNGLYVGRADNRGVEVGASGSDGVYVISAGAHSRANYPTSPNGFAVAGAQGAGLFVGRADQRAVEVISAGWDGVFVSSAGNPSTSQGSARSNGFEVAGAEGFGLYVGRADVNGVEVGSAGYDGIYVLHADRRAATFNGDVMITGQIVNSAAVAKLDHPLDPEQKYLNHAFVESPEMKTIYDGVVVLDANGEAWVKLPDWFEALNKDFRYQLTAIGGPGPGLYIAEEIAGNRFQIAGGEAGLKVSWQVTGVRHDPYAEGHDLVVEEQKSPQEQGTYLHPEAYGQPQTKSYIQRDVENLAQAAGIETEQEITTGD